MVWHVVAALSGASGVGLGAIGAHRLKNKTEKEKNDWNTATRYQLIHSLALAVLPAYQRSNARTAAGVLFTSGIILFSGSIYTYILTDNIKMSGAAPLGGMAFIAGWLSLALLKR
ncbi:hypothetical protein JKP88DRAFT_203142 [Tribonema minus]|uniref:DUF423 domain-containing protein n=1 Tax=Tribonema minus TaxID=303371 RepID=A0A835YJ16_9STRA|nr:hypothetical protein JKP88DRAFT_203142 [Tribonema minus]